MAETRIGKYAIESLTRSMYEDSRCIYREFVQNAADQIDEARALHLDPNDYYDIQITIDVEKRCITVEDTATGVSQSKVAVLRNVACSEKRRGEHKGFRGIGRLGGLGYCSDLTFVTSYKGEDIKTIMHWDADKIIEIVDDETDDSEAGSVIDACISYCTEPESADKHYFRVVMDNVKDDKLLDVEAISNYLSMVAPVDYPTQFSHFSHKIKSYMDSNHLTLDTYNLYVNGDQIYKGYTTRIKDSKNGDYDITDIQFFNHRDAENHIVYWGWYSISEMRGQITTENIPYGMRLRCKNIQIGDENTCKKFFASENDRRFALYFYGEINVVAPYLQPDGRRDYFREGAERAEFEKSITADFVKLKDLCYEASQLRGIAKKISTAVSGQASILKKEENGFINEAEKQQAQQNNTKYEQERAKYTKQFQQRKAKIEQCGSPLSFMLQLLEQQTPGLSTMQQLPESAAVAQQKTHQPKLAHTGLRTDREIYAKYGIKEKNVINIVYGAVYEAIADEQIRDSLINRIEAALTKK